jgi:tetratricopeptide (TPR) repeat protein
MNPIITIIFLLISAVSIAQQSSYSSWQEDEKTNIRLLPKYGNAPKTDEQKASDQELIDKYVAQEGTRLKGSELLVKLGFDYLYKRDFKTAMYRFNQAWLLDPENPNVFWGFGAIYFSFGDVENAIRQYDEGLLLNGNNSNILTDKATIYMSKYMRSQSEEDYSNALTLFKKSYCNDPKNQNTLFKLSVCYFLKKDCENALKYYKECKELGGKPITGEYTKAISQGCKK